MAIRIHNDLCEIHRNFPQYVVILVLQPISKEYSLPNIHYPLPHISTRAEKAAKSEKKAIQIYITIQSHFWNQ